MADFYFMLTKELPSRSSEFTLYAISSIKKTQVSLKEKETKEGTNLLCDRVLKAFNFKKLTLPVVLKDYQNKIEIYSINVTNNFMHNLI